ncbi:pathogenesis-related protein 5-like [Arachis ipaensis]|uniref:pathogenesis-related protein 5-like n=1 Tax=Arachis ipaensis TaxID=130454 RepID=UPI000A2B3A3C|nr:pathogenesis-related protein 5-like [Arachis ipaensis]
MYNYKLKSLWPSIFHSHYYHFNTLLCFTFLPLPISLYYFSVKAMALTSLSSKSCATFWLFLLLANVASATLFTLHNNCKYTVWPGTLSGNNPTILDTGLSLTSGSLVQMTAPAGWSGRFWGRTGCNFDIAGNGKCATGDCSGGLKCTGGGVPPVTLVEFTTGSATNGNKDFYDVSLVDGYNVAIGVQATGGTGDCQYAGCENDLNGYCPKELQVKDDTGSVVACKSACVAFNTPEYCCTGEHSTPQTCSPTNYSKMFKNACPRAYSYAYDDASSTFTCSGANYIITFCPAGSS